MTAHNDNTGENSLPRLDTERIKGVIFDYGGTLDSGGDHWSEVIWKAWQQAGVACSKGEFREAYVYAERELARTRHILPEHDFSDLLGIKMRIELGYLAQNGLFPPAQVDDYATKIASLCYAEARRHVTEAIPVLEAISRRYPMALVSNFYGNIEAVLKDFDILRFFPHIVESAVVGVRKPDPEIFRLGAKALRLEPEQTLVVGDSLKKDILPAESIGCQTLWLKGKGWTAEEDAATHPGTITSLTQILPVLGL